MVVMFKMTPEKKEKMTKKLDKMIDYIEEFKDCLENSDDYDEEEWEDEPQYRGSMRRAGNTSAMRNRYSRKGY